MLLQFTRPHPQARNNYYKRFLTSPNSGVSFTQTEVTVSEGVGSVVTLTIFRNGNPELSANVSFMTVAGSASEGRITNYYVSSYILSNHNSSEYCLFYILCQDLTMQGLLGLWSLALERSLK